MAFVVLLFVLIAIGVGSTRSAYPPPVVTVTKRVPEWLVDAARAAEQAA